MGKVGVWGGGKLGKVEGWQGGKGGESGEVARCER